MIFNLIDKVETQLLFYYDCFKLDRLLVLGLFVSVFFYPSYSEFTRPENLIIPFLLLSIALKPPKIDETFLYLLFAAFVVHILVYLNSQDSGIVLTEGLRWFKLGIIYLFIAALSADVKKFAIDGIFFSLFAVIIINLLQLFNPFELGQFIVDFYKGNEAHVPLFQSQSSIRIIGTETNPNNNAIFLILGGVFSITQHIYSKSFRWLLIGLCCFVLIIFTQSRTAIVALLTLILLFGLAYKINRKYLIGVAITLGLGIVIVFFMNFHYIFQLFRGNPLEVNSVKLRYLAWQQVWEIIQLNPIFGTGSAETLKKYTSASPDNEALFVWATRGIYGLLSFVMILTHLLIKSFKRFEENPIIQSVFFALVMFVIIGFTNVTIYNIRIGMFFFFWLGLTSSEPYKPKNSLRL